jgi:hypothetical protein
MLLTLFYIKESLKNYLIDDVINLIQYDYYKLNESYYIMNKEVLRVFNEFFTCDKIDDKYYMKSYKKKYHEWEGYYNHYNLGYRWYNYTYKDYNNKIGIDNITITCKNFKKKDCIIIKTSPYYNVHDFKRIESRLMENTTFHKMKYKQNRIVMYYL